MRPSPWYPGFMDTQQKLLESPDSRSMKAHNGLRWTGMGSFPGRMRILRTSSSDTSSRKNWPGERCVYISQDAPQSMHDIALTNESMGIGCLHSSAVPVQVEMFRHELDAETQLYIFQLNVHKRLLVTFSRWSFRDDQLSVLKCDFFDVSCLKNHLVVNVDLVFDGLETELGHVGFLVAVVVDDDAHCPQPGHLLSVCIGNKHGIHVELLVADEVEGKAVFSLDSVAESLAG